MKTPLEIYWGPKSPYSSRVLMALEIKRLPYESRRLTFSERDLKSDRFLAINPRAQVPALRHGALTLYESIAILCYLDKIRPEPPLFGDTPAEHGLIWREIIECVYYLEPPMTLFAEAVYSGELDKKRDETIQSRKSIERELSRLNERLRNVAYLVSHRISAADIALYPIIQLLASAALQENTDEVSGSLRAIEVHYPALGAWYRRMETIPGLERTNL
jgi:glutathione S-transferase